ncbi:MAG TPA: hypothetical protein VJV22_20255 [Acidobacteriaceae bacterium]|nr:hypothetical protein [Acidobacteriaceae bacterium]
MPITDAFFSGKLVDENGLAPRTACCTVVTEGDSRGRRGFLRTGSDYEIYADGSFTIPALSPGRYYLRFFGMLQDVESSSVTNKQNRQRLVFDFFYPNAVTVFEALPFDLEAGQTTSAEFQIPKPIWFGVSGRVSGDFDTRNRNLSVLFQRDMGILDGVGGLGFTIRADGGFEGMLLKGTYRASVHEMTNSEPSGYARSMGEFGSTMVNIERDALNLDMRL